MPIPTEMIHALRIALLSAIFEIQETVLPETFQHVIDFINLTADLE